MKTQLLQIQILTLFLSFSCTHQVEGQQAPDYFDFWDNGLWESEITIYNGDTIEQKDFFRVKKLENKNAFQEDWKIYIGNGEYVEALVIRAFDGETKSWKLFYIDDMNAQNWTSSEMNNQIIFTKEFTYNGKKFYSRQSWIPLDAKKVQRTIERSEDNINWKPRYWQIFRRIN